MEEKEIIRKIRKLRKIRPRKDWVVLTKSQILGSPANNFREIWAGEEKRFELLPFFKPIYSGLFLILFLIGLFEISQSALPGERLYSLKRIFEKVQTIFVSEKEEPKIQLELANKRLEELNKIAIKNEVKKLAPAMKEAQASLAEAAKKLVKLEKVDKEEVESVINLKKNLKRAETILGTKIGREEDKGNIENWTKEQVEMLIKDLENRTLAERQEEILAQMKELVAEEKYSEALELYLLNQ